MSIEVRNKFARAEGIERRSSLADRNLIASVIERSVLDLKSPHQSLRINARTWLFSNKKSIWGMLWCAEQLDWDEATLLKLRKKCSDLITFVDGCDAGTYKRWIGQANDIFKY